MKDLHITLPDETVEKVDSLARAMKETRNGLIRRAVDLLLEAERKRKLASDMRSYAEDMGAASGEFVKETETVVLKKLMKETRW